MPPRPSSGKPLVKAVLGSTNTGKTHLAVERMLGHASGMIGLPLRLLAREIYDRAVKAKGRARVALITGEEKILPERPAWFIATAEAMPLSEPVEFLAVDEIQLCADPERGHTFTNRLLAARGLSETMVLGSDTMAGAVRNLLPEAEVVSRARFSELKYTKPKRIGRLPKRTAVIAFTAESVYAAAEVLRRTYGGAAVVMGALSPSTRNAQVELYQSGAVDYIVATDAIGMGLNMDIDHVVFAETEKFDGAIRRPLKPEEVAQIAGRAGRHMASGTFSTLDEEDVGSFPAGVIERVESHRFAPVPKLQWRNADLDFGSPKLLLKSLEQPPDHALLVAAQGALDVRVLRLLAEDAGIQAATPEAVRRLWMACQIPDFQGVAEGAHAAFCAGIYGFLSQGRGVIPHAWMAKRVAALDSASGGIEDLLRKIAAIRTYTYIAHHPGWLAEAAHWSFTTRALEDKLSSALHERLTQRFVDLKTSALIKSMRGSAALVAIDTDDTVSLEGHELGKIKGFAFLPVREAGHADQALMRKAAEKAVRKAMAARAAQFLAEGAKTPALVLPKGKGPPVLQWRGETIATLAKGAEASAPEVALAGHPLLDDAQARDVLGLCRAVVAARIKEHLSRLLELKAAVEDAKEPLSPRARGLGFRLVENFGVIPRNEVKDELRDLPLAERKVLHTYAVWFGAHFFYQPPLLKPAASSWRLALWALWNGVAALPAVPEPGVLWTVKPARADEAALRVLGFATCGAKMVRIDRLESLADAVRPLSLAAREFAVTPEIMGIVGLSGSEFAAAMGAIGYAWRTEKIKAGEEEKDRYLFRWSPPAKAKGESRRAPSPKRPPPPKDSPFAVLKDLKLKAKG
jgi:ATP-dependent RNA helicase SUPV3L1/SUV3